MKSFDEQKADLIQKIHNTPHLAVLAITGGGTEAIGELLRHGNGSKTLLDAVIPYDQTAFDDFVKGKPDKYCSAEAARTLAMAAYQRAIFLTKDRKETAPLVGIGATCSLVKNGPERSDRKHVIYVAYQTDSITESREYEIDHSTQTFTREQEESFAADCILNELAEGCNLDDEDKIPQFLPNKNSFKGAGPVTTVRRLLMQNKVPVVTVNVNPPPTTSKYILPGSFNPVHDGHLDIAKTVLRLKGERIDFEISVRNVDKPPINFVDMQDRERGLTEKIKDQPWAGNIHFTNASTFVEKAKLFPGATFVVGFDTFSRIPNPKYYGGEDNMYAAIDAIRRADCKFLVFNRVTNGKAATMKDFVDIPYFLRNLAEMIPDSEHTPCGTSSSEIRKSCERD